jgi:hypothetical protein
MGIVEIYPFYAYNTVAIALTFDLKAEPLFKSLDKWHFLVIQTKVYI